MSIRSLPEQIEAVDVVEGDSAVMQGTGEVVIDSVQILDSDAHPRQRFQTNEDLVVSVTFSTQVAVKDQYLVSHYFAQMMYTYTVELKFDNVFEGEYHGTYTFFIRW